MEEKNHMNNKIVIQKYHREKTVIMKNKNKLFLKLVKLGQSSMNIKYTKDMDQLKCVNNNALVQKDQ